MCSKKTGYELWRDVFGNPKYAAAPMVDMSELSFRDLCRKYNSQLCFTPMLHSQQFVQDSLYRSDCFSTTSEDRPLIVQFCANDPSVFVAAANLVSSQCDAVDLNLGCPQAIAKKGHYGAFLQDEWELIRSIVQKASSEVSVPITCKMRILPGSSSRSIEYARMLEGSGCSVLTVHGRTRVQKGHDTGLASWDVIRDIKQSVHIPVIANGNILCFDDVQACLNYTGADAVMSAEGLLHNPALFSGTNPPVWEIAEEYLNLAMTYQTPLRYVRNHMYRLMYLCLHRDSNLRSLLEEALSYDDFLGICKYLKTSVEDTKNYEQAEEQQSDLFLSSLNDHTQDDFHIAELFAHKVLVDNGNCNLQKISPLQSESSENLFQSLKLENEDSYESERRYLPVWLCHSRPRITFSGNRGCYSKYFASSNESKEEEEEEEVYLSKRQRRKERHYMRVLAAMKKNRKAKKLRQKQKRLETKENGTCSEEKVKATASIPKKELRLAIRQRLLAARGNSPKICIDLGFSSSLSTKELTRLATQLRRLYGSNRQTSKPVHLYFCNFRQTDPLYDICISKNDGFSSYVVDMVETSLDETFSPNDVIYLSPDSENVLDTLDINKVYVIGGIVDVGVQKGLTLNKAKNLQVQTACLPIRQRLISTGSGSSILTVNQVFDVLLTFCETGDWVKSLATGVPKRKGFRIPEPTTELNDSHPSADEIGS